METTYVENGPDESPVTALAVGLSRALEANGWDQPPTLTAVAIIDDEATALIPLDVWQPLYAATGMPAVAVNALAEAVDAGIVPVECLPGLDPDTEKDPRWMGYALAVEGWGSPTRTCTPVRRATARTRRTARRVAAPSTTRTAWRNAT